MQGTLVQSLVREDPTCRGATKPVSTITKPVWSLGATTMEPTCYNYWDPGTLEPVLCNGEAAAVRSPRPQLENSPSSPRESRAQHSQKENIFLKRMTKNIGEDTEQPKLSHTVDEIVKWHDKPTLEDISFLSN